MGIDQPAKGTILPVGRERERVLSGRWKNLSLVLLQKKKVVVEISASSWPLTSVLNVEIKESGLHEVGIIGKAATDRKADCRCGGRVGSATSLARAEGCACQGKCLASHDD